MAKRETTFNMAKKYKKLRDKICSWENILLAYQKASSGKKNTRAYLEFREYDLINLKNIQTELLTGTYKMDPSRDFNIYVPKERNIKALSFRDRVVQHAINNIIEPIFEKTFFDNSYACRKNKGTHAAVKYAQSIMRKYKEPLYYLKTDYRKYFRSIDHNILHSLYQKKIKCKFTLNLLEITFPRDEKNLPVGWLLSQLSANIYGTMIDHYIHHDLKHRDWVRYMDDIVIFDTDIERLKQTQQKMAQFSNDSMLLTFSKWHTNPVTKNVNFLGYRIWPKYKLIRKDSVLRAKQKLARYRKYDLNDKIRSFSGSWNGHIQWADCFNLKRKIYDF